MTYQDEEVLPALNNNNKLSAPKTSFAVATVLVLCLAVTSFAAGHAYASSSATASTVSVSSQFPKYGWCLTLDGVEAITGEDCGGDDAAQCALDAIYSSMDGNSVDIMDCNLNGSETCGGITLPTLKKYCID